MNVIEYNPKKLISDALQSYNMLRKTAGLMCGVFKTNIYEEISELKSKTHIKEFDEINDFVSYHDDILEKMAV